MANRPYKQFYVATTGDILSSGTTTDLGIGQLGFFNPVNWQATTAPNFPTVQSIVIAQGTPELQLAEGEMQSDVSFKSKPIFGKNIQGARVVKAQKPQQRIISVGFDGVDNSKTLTAKPGDTLTVYLTLTGQPISRFYTDDQKGLIVPLTVGTPCPDECSDNCGDTVPANTLADNIIKSFNDYRIYGNQKLSDYVKVEKLVDCNTPSGFTTQSYTKWCLTICDDGTNTALGKVQAQYPGLKVTRKSRLESLSTYELEDATGDGAPANYVNESTSVVPNCSSCPSGYTFVPEYSVFEIIRDGNVTANTIDSAYSGLIIAGSVVKLSTDGGRSIFTVFVNGTTLTAQATDIVSLVATRQGLCTLDSGVETSWESCGTCTKAEKAWQISLKDTPCGVSRLADLQAAYAGIGTVTVIENDSDFCTRLYKLVTLSDNYCPDCDSPLYQWLTPPSFEGNDWTPVITTDGPGTDCVAGVRFTSAFYMPERDACTFDGIPYYSDPLYIEVSTFDPEQTDICSDEPGWAPVTLLQEIKFPKGYGNFISALEKLDKYYKNVFYNADPVVRKYRGWEWNTEFKGYYDEIVLNYSVNIGGTFGSQVRTEYYEDHYFIPQTESSEFLNTLNSFLSTVDVPLVYV